MGHSGSLKKLIHEKTWSRNSRGTVPLNCFYLQVVEKWLGKEACSSQEFDGIDLTNRLGSDKVLFKVTWDFHN